MQIELAKVLRGRKKPTILRPVTLTRTLELEGCKIFRRPVEAWADGILRLHLSYSTKFELFADDLPSNLIEEVNAIGDAALAVAVSAPVSEWVETVAQRHEYRFVSAVQAATKFDVSAFLTAHADEIGTYREWSTSLIKDISEETRRKVSAKIMDAIANRIPPGEVQKDLRDIVKSARKRALLIASDQANKIHSKMQELRAQEVGITEYIWRTAGDERVRLTHANANGRRFSWNKPPHEIGRHPGEPIRCRCSAQAYIPLLDEE